MEIDPSDHTGRQNYQLLSGMVVPRPIAFVTSLSADGLLNAAPFAYFNAIANKPPLVYSLLPIRVRRGRATPERR